MNNNNYGYGRQTFGGTNTDGIGYGTLQSDTTIRSIDEGGLGTGFGIYKHLYLLAFQATPPYLIGFGGKGGKGRPYELETKIKPCTLWHNIF